MNKGFASNNITVSGPLFDDDSVARELELIADETKTIQWQSPNGELFSLELPHTVYPPREDTDFMAKNLIKIGPGKRRKCLELGIGSGVLSLLCHRQGWDVSACDINPIAVACARQFLRSNSAKEVQVREGGIGPEYDGKPIQWSPSKKYDLIFWNMPYLKLEDDSQAHLGPLEEAALIDTSKTSLVYLTIKNIKSLELLKKSGTVMLTVGEHLDEDELIDICAKFGFAGRIVDELIFADGERLKLLTLWHPFARHPTICKDVVTSTNSELLAGNWPVGSSLSARRQTNGRGRYDREWVNAADLLACSWKLPLSKILSPGATQIIIGYLVKQSLESIQTTDDKARVILKWPNDLIILANERRGKVCGVLLESVSIGNDTTMVAGIGVNISQGNQKIDYDFDIAFADWCSDHLTADYVQMQLHCRIASLFEAHGEIPPANFSAIKISAFNAIKDGFNSSSRVLYRNDPVKFSHLNDDGSVALIDSEDTLTSIGEGEVLEWSF